MNKQKEKLLVLAALFPFSKDPRKKELKRMIKKRYKEYFPTIQEQKPKGFINSFVFWNEDGESRKEVFVFKNSLDVMRDIESMINLEETPNYYDYSPTGLWFGERAEIKTFRDRVVVIKPYSLDC